MNRFGLDTGLIHKLREFVRAVFRSGEDEGRWNIVFLHHVEEQVSLPSLVDHEHRVINHFGRGRIGCDLDVYGIGEHAVRERENTLGHRRRKEKRLPMWWDFLDEFLDIVNESHVEHAIGFIECEELEFIQWDVSLVLEVEESSGGRYHDVDTLLELPYLCVLLHASKDHCVVKSQSLSVRGETLTDLNREFSCGCNDEDFYS